MTYLVNIKLKNESGQAIGKIQVGFYWRKMGKNYKSFEPTAHAKKILDQFPSWENLDIDKNTSELERYEQ